MLIDLFKQLEKLTPSEKNTARFEKILAEISKKKNTESIGLLLPFLNDDAEVDELMFSIIHLIEMFEDRIYVKEIIKGIVKLWKKSPRWATIIHMRILNSQSTLDLYIKELNNISYEQKRIIEDLFKNLISKRPEFQQRCKRIQTMIVEKNIP